MEGLQAVQFPLASSRIIPGFLGRQGRQLDRRRKREDCEHGTSQWKPPNFLTKGDTENSGEACIHTLDLQEHREWMTVTAVGHNARSEVWESENRCKMRLLVYSRKCRTERRGCDELG